MIKKQKVLNLNKRQFVFTIHRAEMERRVLCIQVSSNMYFLFYNQLCRSCRKKCGFWPPLMGMLLNSAAHLNEKSCTVSASRLSALCYQTCGLSFLAFVIHLFGVDPPHLAQHLHAPLPSSAGRWPSSPSRPACPSGPWSPLSVCSSRPSGPAAAWSSWSGTAPSPPAAPAERLPTKGPGQKHYADKSQVETLTVTGNAPRAEAGNARIHLKCSRWKV